MSEFLANVWARGWLFVLAVGVASALFTSGSLIRGLIVSAIGFPVIVAAAIFGYFRERRRAPVVSVKKTRLMAKGALPPRREVDNSRPLIGVIVKGRWEGFYVSVSYEDGQKVDAAEFRVAGRKWPHKLVDGVDWLSPSELASEVATRHVRFLPQGDYADQVWRRVFERD